MSESETALGEIERRWMEIFCSLAEGRDVPPSQRLRAEGMMETLVLLKLVELDELQSRLEDCYARGFGQPLSAGWKEQFPFPQIPGFAERAPVYPSTRD